PIPRPPRSPLFPYTTLFRSLTHSCDHADGARRRRDAAAIARGRCGGVPREACSERRSPRRRTNGSLVGVMAVSTFAAGRGTLDERGQLSSALDEPDGRD